MNKAIPFTDLESLFRNHRDNSRLPIMTNSIVIELLQLDKFVTQAKNTPDCDAIKIHLIRYPLTADKGHIKKTPSANLSQISLAFVPANITSFEDWTADDLPNQDNKIFTLLVCEPTTPRGPGITRDRDNTGLCPPNRGCT